MSRESVLCAHAVHERGSGFCGCTCEIAARVAGGIKYKGSGAGESVGLQPEKCGQLDYCCASELVDIGLDAGRCATEIELSVAV